MTALTLSGNRQSGKTEFLIGHALDQAACGKRVIYACSSGTTLADTFMRARSKVENGRYRKKLKQVRIANGNESIEFNSGGKVFFLAANRGGGRGLTADIGIVDGCDDHAYDTVCLAAGDVIRGVTA